MGLTASQIAQLNKIEAEMARKGFALGDLLNTEVTALEALTAYNSQASAADPGDAGAISITSKLTRLTSGGTGETRTLAAPAAGYTGILIIEFETDGGGDVVVDGANVLGLSTEDYTFADAGDTVVLIANSGGQWVQIGGNLTAA